MKVLFVAFVLLYTVFKGAVPRFIGSTLRHLKHIGMKAKTLRYYKTLTRKCLSLSLTKMDGLQLEKIGPTFQVTLLSSRKKMLPCFVFPLLDSYEVFLLELQGLKIPNYNFSSAFTKIVELIKTAPIKTIGFIVANDHPKDLFQ